MPAKNSDFAHASPTPLPVAPPIKLSTPHVDLFPQSSSPGDMEEFIPPDCAHILEDDTTHVWVTSLPGESTEAAGIAGFKIQFLRYSDASHIVSYLPIDHKEAEIRILRCFAIVEALTSRLTAPECPNSVDDFHSTTLWRMELRCFLAYVNRLGGDGVLEDYLPDFER